jgi:hypothetical protein
MHYFDFPLFESGEMLSCLYRAHSSEMLAAAYILTTEPKSSSDWQPIPSITCGCCNDRREMIGSTTNITESTTEGFQEKMSQFSVLFTPSLQGVSSSFDKLSACRLAIHLH